jgi:hypothetical protein
MNLPARFLLLSSAFVIPLCAQNLCSPAPTGLPALAGVLPALPQGCSVPTYPQPAKTVKVSTMAALQSAVNAAAASCGTRIVLAKGKYPGALVIPASACSANRNLLESANIEAFPSSHTVPYSKAGTGAFPVLEATSSVPAISISDNAAGWYFAGLDVTALPTALNLYDLWTMGVTTTSTAALPHDITIDRCVIHGPPIPASGVTNYVARAVNLNAVNGTVMYSAIYGIVNPGQDTQAINVYNSPGPIQIFGNWLRASGENIMLFSQCLGYNYPYCPVVSDVTIRRNHIGKDAAWRSLPKGCVFGGQPQCYDVKNLIELKNGQRVLVDSNVLDTTFAQAQDEAIIMNCDLTWPTQSTPQTCTDFTVTNNLIEHAPIFGVLAGNGNAQTGQRILVRNNIALDISATNWGGPGSAFQIQRTNSLTVDHNTVLNTPLYNALEFADALPSTNANLQYSNNLQYGPPFADGMSPGQTMIGFPSPTFGQVVLVGDTWAYLNQNSAANLPTYPAGIFSLSSPGCTFNTKVIATCWPLDWAIVGFIDFAGGAAGTNLAGLALSSTSPYKRKATDGADVGADVAAVLAAINGIQ